jgi:hypothetical protein
VSLVLAVFVDKGVEGATVMDITAAAGVTQDAHNTPAPGRETAPGARPTFRILL